MLAASWEVSGWVPQHTCSAHLALAASPAHVRGRQGEPGCPHARFCDTLSSLSVSRKTQPMIGILLSYPSEKPQPGKRGSRKPRDPGLGTSPRPGEATTDPARLPRGPSPPPRPEDKPAAAALQSTEPPARPSSRQRLTRQVSGSGSS